MLDFTGKTEEVFDFMGIHGLPKPAEHVLRKQLDQTKGEVPFQWRSKLNFSEVDAIQKPCKASMKSWGYRQFSSVEELKAFKNPLIPYTL